MRLQHYYQFQVILKPSPLNIQELYLNSLKMIGIDANIHDIRFVEDNWESEEQLRIITGHSKIMKDLVLAVVREYELDYHIGDKFGANTGFIRIEPQ